MKPISASKSQLSSGKRIRSSYDMGDTEGCNEVACADEAAETDLDGILRTLQHIDVRLGSANSQLNATLYRYNGGQIDADMPDNIEAYGVINSIRTVISDLEARMYHLEELARRLGYVG